MSSFSFASLFSVSIVLDLIILAITGLTIYFAYRNGFVKTVLSALSFLIALVVALVLRAPVTSLLEQTPLADGMTNGVESALNAMTESTEESLASLIRNSGSTLHSALDSIGVENESLEEWLSTMENQSNEGLLSPLAEKIAPKIGHVVLSVVSFIVLFFLTLVLVKILSSLLTGLTERIAALRFANKTLGVIIGIVLAAVRVLLFCVIAQFLLNQSGLIGWKVLSEIHPENTILFRFITNLILPGSMV